MKPILAVMVGISGSGKSFYSAGLQVSLSAKLIETDAIRQELTGDASDQTQNHRVFLIAKRRTNDELAQGKNVIIDATSINVKDRKDWVEIGKANNAEVRAYYVDVPVNVAKERNTKRLRQVPDWVIDKQLAKLQPPFKSEGFDLVVKV